MDGFRHHDIREPTLHVSFFSGLSDARSGSVAGCGEPEAPAYTARRYGERHAVGYHRLCGDFHDLQRCARHPGIAVPITCVGAEA